MKRITNPAELQQARLFYIPAAVREARTFQLTRAKAGDAEAYTWKDATTGRLFAVCFLGRAQNAWSGRQSTGGAYWFRTEAQRRAFIARLCEVARSIHERHAKRKAEKAEALKAGHALAVGDVLRASWGYDQTNIDYYQVTKLVGKQSVEIREIAQQRMETLSMQGECVPMPDVFKGEAMTKRVSTYGDRDSVRLNSFSSAYKVQPKVIAGLKVYPASHWTAHA